MIATLVSLLIIIIVCALIYWIVTLLPLPAPFRQIACALVAIIFAVLLIFYVLLPIVGRVR